MRCAIVARFQDLFQPLGYLATMTISASEIALFLEPNHYQNPRMNRFLLLLLLVVVASVVAATAEQQQDSKATAASLNVQASQRSLQSLRALDDKDEGDDGDDGDEGDEGDEDDEGEDEEIPEDGSYQTKEGLEAVSRQQKQDF